MVRPRQPTLQGIRPAEAALLAAAASMFVLLLGGMTTLDHDLLHGMSLAREALAREQLPKEDLFAYTPTIMPVVHHEWATGLMIYFVVKVAGSSGLMAVKYALTALVVLFVVVRARRSGCGWTCFCATALVIMLPGILGFTTIRAQLITLLFTALLLLFLDLDRDGRRRWVWLWLPAFVCWLNLHAGFVVGFGLIAAHWLEGLVRGRGVQVHLLAVLAAMAGLMFLTPYGTDFPRYLARGLSMPRPDIPEWQPIWEAYGRFLVPYVASLGLVLYAIIYRGTRDTAGLLVVLICAAAALRNVRNASIYAVAWLGTVPVWIQTTPLGQRLELLVERHQGRVTWAATLMTLGMLSLAVQLRPWLLQIPHSAEDVRRDRPVVYPTGAVQYLKEQGFKGNVMTPFRAGAYVTWYLFPTVRISLDGRYEVAFQPGVFEAIESFYRGDSGWRQTLDRWPTDLVLAPATSPVVGLLVAHTEWRRVYRDGVFELFARPGLELPMVERFDQTAELAFP